MSSNLTRFPVRDYNLAATLSCGQAFRWEGRAGTWRAVIRGRWVELQQADDLILARTALPQADWRWLENYLQLDVDYAAVVRSFPDDAPMRSAVAACRGLRLLRQEPWECLASFILSSTKQIVQIRQIIVTLCARHGEPVAVPPGEVEAFAFPTAAQVAALTEAQLRDCKMGFRATYLLQSARAIAGGGLARNFHGPIETPTIYSRRREEADSCKLAPNPPPHVGGYPVSQLSGLDLATLGSLPLPGARERLLQLPGVGPKIADCVLLFAFGFPTAFPVDVWVMKALRRFYFRNRRVNLARLRDFAATHFGPNAGYAQQYLFHSLRLSEGKGFRPEARKL